MQTLIAQPKWELKFSLDMAYCPELRITAENGPVLTLDVVDDIVRIKFYTQWHGNTVKFGQDPLFSYQMSTLYSSGEIKLVWLGYVCQLYVDDTLMDEEWPLGNLVQGAWTLNHNKGVIDCKYHSTMADGKHTPHTMTFQSSEFALSGYNAYVGDCMPFNRNGEYCLFYLFDRRHHKSKQGLGAHQWGQLVSADLKTWVNQPLAIDITEQWEGSICTGSLLQVEDTTYAFYAVRMSDGSPAMLSWATSRDGVNFQKSEQYFSLTEPYEPVSARDPMVFADATGQYHMLVTTSLKDQGVYGGCLAHLISYDLKKWIQKEPFIVPGYADQPECSDYFEWNGWYYLVFSNYATARYRMSRYPFGPWTRPSFDELDARDIHVPKTASFRGRRLSSGFLSTQPHQYAGTAITHELFQRVDGTLGTKHVEELLPSFSKHKKMNEIKLDAGSGRVAYSAIDKADNLRLKGTFVSRVTGTLAGIQIWFDDKEQAYDLNIDFDHECARVLMPGETNPSGNGTMPLTRLRLDGQIEIDLIIFGDVMDVALADGRMITCRIERAPGSQVSVKMYAQAGCASFTGGQYEMNEQGGNDDE